jgi:hypothetical protein
VKELCTFLFVCYPSTKSTLKSHLIHDPSWVKLRDIRLSKISQTSNKKYCVVLLLRFIEEESRMWLLGVGREGNGKFLFNGFRISVCNDAKVLVIGLEAWLKP